MCVLMEALTFISLHQVGKLETASVIVPTNRSNWDDSHSIITHNDVSLVSITPKFPPEPPTEPPSAIIQVMITEFLSTPLTVLTVQLIT